MISKQDKVATRTAAGLEQKYYFGKTFAEVMGIATDAQSAASEAKETANATAARLTHEEIFNLLTNNGTLQGIYRGDDGELYVNGEYIKAKTLRADVVRLDSGDDPTGYRFSSDDDFLAFSDEMVAELNLFEQKNFNAYLSFEPFNCFGLVSITSCYALDRTTLVTVLTPNEHFVRIYMDGLGWSTWRHINGETEYTSGIWKVRHHNDGTCELWGTVEATANLLSWGNVYYAEDVIAQQAYPVTFASAPTVTATPKTASEYCYGLLSGTQEGTVAASPSFGIWRANAASASIPVQVDLYVKGTLA